MNNTSVYKAIKKEVGGMDLYYKSIDSSRFYLASSFDSTFKIGADKKESVKAFINKITDVFGKKVNFIFTFAEFKRIALIYPLNTLSNIKVIVNDDSEKNELKSLVSVAKRKEFSVLDQSQYSLVDRRCNLDIRLDLLKLYSLGDSVSVCFYEPEAINKCFFFFKNVLVLRHLKELEDSSGGTFPVDKFRVFHQEKQTFPLDGLNQIELYSRG
tara:strand:- start:1629 stop:2267 length:639 start_codon:yes stop_codon:yes gene_type:complete